MVCARMRMDMCQDCIMGTKLAEDGIGFESPSQMGLSKQSNLDN